MREPPQSIHYSIVYSLYGEIKLAKCSNKKRSLLIADGWLDLKVISLSVEVVFDPVLVITYNGID